MHGNGFSDPADDFGIGVIGTATGNVIDENIVTGNTQGIVIQAGARATTIRAEHRRRQSSDSDRQHPARPEGTGYREPRAHRRDDL